MTVIASPMSATPPPLHRRRDPPPGFDFTSHMRRLCDDMIARLDQLRHIDMSRVAVSFSQTRRAGSRGMYAAVTPLRFAEGQMHTVRRGRRWGMQRLYDPDGREMLYILNFYLPRFLDLPFREKLTTVTHELWHIGPKCDGDVRRLGGRCFAHGHSQKQYDAHAEALLDRWLSLGPPEPLYDFLRLKFHDLLARHGRVIGRRVPTPKLVPVD
jgi:predicted metallopeptidase